MQKVIQSFFQLRPEDRSKVWIMGTVFFLAGVSEMINYTSFMAIFNSRIGTAYLPMMYLAEAILLPLEGWLLSFFSQRIAKPKFMVGLYGFFIAIGLFNGIVLLVYRYAEIQWAGFYVLLFLTSNFVVRQQTLLMWGTAFDLCPTQQAKRVMPVFVLAAIIGGIIAGVASSTLASWIGSELLYLLSAVVLLLGLPNFIRSIKQYLLPLTFGDTSSDASEEKVSSSFYFKQIIRSPFLLTVIGIMTFMPAVYFLMEYQYFTTAQDAFSSESELTAFYGLMVIILFCAAFLLQLFAARLIDWLGASNTIFAIAVIYLGSFMLVGAGIGGELALVAVSFGYSMLYLLLYYFAEPSYQFFFKMLPLQHRDGYRYTAQSIAASAGILLGSGVSMLHSAAGVTLTVQSIIGIALAAALVVLAWGARHLYIRELVHYLEVSSSSVQNFIHEIMESMTNDRVRKVLTGQLSHPNEHVQRFTLELLSRQPDHALSSALWSYAKLNKGELRAFALEAMHPAGWKGITGSLMESLLKDSHEGVRAIAYHRLFASASSEDALQLPHYVQSAHSDSSLLVRVEAWRVMERNEGLYEELRQQLRADREAAVHAIEIIGERKLYDMYFDVMMAMMSEEPVVKLTAVRTIGKIGGGDLVASLMELLVGGDKELRLAIEESLIELREAAMPELIRFIESPNDVIWRTAVTVCAEIGSDQELNDLVVPSCLVRLRTLSASHTAVEAIEAMNRPDWTALAKLRVEEITASVLDTIWRVMIRFGDERSVPQLRAAVESDMEEIRDHGLEILSEGLGHSKLNNALLAYYRRQSDNRQQGSEQQAADSSGEEMSDPWLQALAVKSGAAEGGELLMGNWEYLNALDKMMFLKQVPLFKDISIEELGRIASIAYEKSYQDGEFLIRQGEVSAQLMIIMEGHVELSGKNNDGTEGTIGVVSSKQTIGEAGLFDERPSQVSAQVLFDEAKVLEIAGVEVVKLVRLYPEIGVGLLRAISGRLMTLEHMLLKLG